jgi:hypothetical protein
MENFLAEKYVPKQVILPVDLNTGANTGLRVDMKNAKRVTFLITLAAGTTTAAHGISLHQHNAASAGTSKALSVDNPYYHKVGAATKLTKVDIAGVPADTYDLHALLADNVAIVAFEVLADDLDRALNFEWVSLDITDTGGAQLGNCVAIVSHDFAPAYAQVV